MIVSRRILNLLVAGCAACGGGEPAPREALRVVHLFDQLPQRVEYRDRLPPELREFLDAGAEVDVLETFSRDSLGMYRAPRGLTLPGLYFAPTVFEATGEPRAMPYTAAAEPGAGAPTDEPYPREKGRAIVGPRGLFVALDKPLRVGTSFAVRYRARSEDIRARLAPSPRAGEDKRLPTRELSLGPETRRAATVPRSSRLTWKTVLPNSPCRLELAFGLEPLLAMVRDDHLELRRNGSGTANFTVAVTRENEPPVVMYERSLTEAGHFVSAAPDLSAFAGSEVQLDFIVDAEEGAPLPFWAEPVLAAGRGPTAPPNLLVLLLDTLRADRLGCYGWERARTPTLDALATRGVRFADATSAAPWTLPAHASLFTSSYASQHGLWAADHRLPDAALTIAEVLREHGYRTGAFTGGGYVGTAQGFGQGFDLFYESMDDPGDTFDRLRSWVEVADAPWFAFVQTYLVHSPYDPPLEHRDLVRPYEGALGARVNPVRHDWGRHGPNTLSGEDVRYVSDLYDAEIAALDQRLGALLAELEAQGALENTLILVTSDHGDEFADHGHFEHGYSLYQEMLHVPLIAVLPGHFEGGLVAAHPVHLVDVAPTLAALAGAAVPELWAGQQLSVTAADERVLFTPFFTRDQGEPTTAARMGSLKYVDYGTERRPSDASESPALYDLSTDPGERVNLLTSEEAPRWAERMAEQWRLHPAGAATENSTLAAEALERLRELGYIDDH